MAPSLGRAQIVLNINTDAQRIWFTGSASGNYSATNPAVEWETGTGSFTTYNFPGAGMFTGDSFVGHFDVGSGASSTYFAVSAALNASGAVTLGGRGSAYYFDYSGWTSAEKSLLEGLIGGSIPLSAGSGFGAMSVSLSAIPEPTTYALFAGAVMLVGAIAVRRRRALERAEQPLGRG